MTSFLVRLITPSLVLCLMVPPLTAAADHGLSALLRRIPFVSCRDVLRRPIEPAERLGSGTEGMVYQVKGSSGLAIKVLKPTTWTSGRVNLGEGQSRLVFEKYQLLHQLLGDIVVKPIELTQLPTGEFGIVMERIPKKAIFQSPDERAFALRLRATRKTLEEFKRIRDVLTQNDLFFLGSVEFQFAVRSDGHIIVYDVDRLVSHKEGHPFYVKPDFETLGRAEEFHSQLDHWIEIVQMALAYH